MLGSMWEVTVDGGVLEAVVPGSGEPLAFVPAAAGRRRVVPLGRRLQDRVRVIRYHRRGYAGSSPAVAPGSVVPFLGRHPVG